MRLLSSHPRFRKQPGWENAFDTSVRGVVSLTRGVSSGRAFYVSAHTLLIPPADAECSLNYIGDDMVSPRVLVLRWRFYLPRGLYFRDT